MREVALLDPGDGRNLAVQTEQGLVVPVVRDCASRSVEELDTDVKRLAEGARAGTLKPIVGKELPLAEAARAHKEIIESSALGKIVLVP